MLFEKVGEKYILEVKSKIYTENYIQRNEGEIKYDINIIKELSVNITRKQ